MVIFLEWILFLIKGSQSIFGALLPNSSIGCVGSTVLGLNFGEVIDAAAIAQALDVRSVEGL